MGRIERKLNTRVSYKKDRKLKIRYMQKHKFHVKTVYLRPTLNEKQGRLFETKINLINLLNINHISIYTNPNSDI